MEGGGVPNFSVEVEPWFHVPLEHDRCERRPSVLIAGISFGRMITTLSSSDGQCLWLSNLHAANPSHVNI